MLLAFTSPEEAGPRLSRWFFCVALSALFVLGSAFPQFQALLPRDPARYAAVPGRVHAQPVIWFPLAYTLSGLPETGWTPGQGPQLHERAPAGEHAYVVPLLKNEPALPATAALCLASAMPAIWLRRLRGRRPRVPDLSALDPPPRLQLAFS